MMTQNEHQNSRSQIMKLLIFSNFDQFLGRFIEKKTMVRITVKQEDFMKNLQC